MSVIEKIKEEDAKTKQKQREIAFNYLFDNAKDKVAVGKFTYLNMTLKLKSVSYTHLTLPTMS